jgi:hypothetical protein
MKISSSFSEFGNNIPNYLQYEGGGMDGCTFLCCVDIKVDVDKICSKYNQTCSKMYQIEIDEQEYNNNYTIHPTYSRCGIQYILEKNHNN